MARDLHIMPSTPTDSDLPVTQLSVIKKKWRYRGEGNANLVIALPEDRVILRVHKVRRNAMLTEQLEFEEKRRACREAFFCLTVMVPLLGKAYIQPPTVARVQHKEIQQLDHILLPQRPVLRHHKGISLGYVTIYPDYALLPEWLVKSTFTRNNHNHCQAAPSPPTFCVEIKPKQGWVPTSVHHPKCTFCLNQYLKLYNGAISRISQYCPLDLFSGYEKRMKNAIKALLKTPQNNLKIFKDGQLVYSGESNQDLTSILHQWLDPESSIDNNHTAPFDGSFRLIDSFCSLVYQALTTNLATDSEPECQFCPLIRSQLLHRCSSLDNSVAEQLQPCNLLSKPLPSNCILDRILRIQKLQQHDTETIYQMLWQYGEGDDYEYVKTLVDPFSGKLSLNPVQSYLLATTAKDCSVLITFQKLSDGVWVPEKHQATDVSGSRFLFNIGVSDLDPKPLSCVEKHRLRDRDIKLACRSLLGSSDPPNTQGDR